MCDYILVIRYAGERTKDACLQILKQQMPAENIFVVEEYPFEQALRKCYRIGIESGKKWMITVDADVLPHKNFVQNLLSQTKNVSKNIFQFEGVVWDKLLQMYKKAGHRVYQTRHLPIAAKQIPEAGSAIRPESHVVRQMRRLGYPSKSTTIIAGLHDHEQYYADIYRKTYVHASKHALNVVDLLQKWKTLSQHDNDYKVAIRAVLDGLLHPEKAVIDSRVYAEKSTKALKELELQEKHPFASNHNIEKYVEEIIASLDGYVRPDSFKRFGRDASEKGLLKTLKYAVGGYLVNRGIALKNNNS